MGIVRMLRVSVLALVVSVAASACSSTTSTAGAADASDPNAASVTQAIGPAGGVVQVGGATVTFPKGAVAADVSVTIRVDTTVPDGFVALSKIFKCEPSGTTFLVPVEMRMPFVDDGKGGTLFWSNGADPTFKDLGGKIDGATLQLGIRGPQEVTGARAAGPVSRR